MKKKVTNKLDEMQEQKMLKIEHTGCWLAFWGLFAALVIQVFIYGAGEWRHMAGEWIVFMCLALYISIDCIRNGVWDRRLSPTPIVNIYVSLIAGAVVAVLNFTMAYKTYAALLGAVATGIISGVLCCGLCFGALTFGASIYKKRVSHFEQEDTEEGRDK